MRHAITTPASTPGTPGRRRLVATLSTVTLSSALVALPTTPASATSAPLLSLVPDDRSVALSWTPVAGADTYRISRDGVPVATVPGGRSGWTDSALDNGISHSYAVAALAGSTVVAATGPLSGTPLDLQPPEVEGTGAVRHLDGGVVVHWSADPRTSEPTQYRLYVGGELVGVSAAGRIRGSFSVGGLTATPSELVLAAVDELGNLRRLWQAYGTSGDFEPPAAPLRLRATACTTGSVSLAWDTVGGGLPGDVAAGFRVERDGELVGSPTQPSHTVTGLPTGVPTTFTVHAVDEKGNASPDSYGLDVTPLGTGLGSKRGSDGSSSGSDCVVTAPDRLSVPSAPQVTLDEQPALLARGTVAFVQAQESGRQLAAYRLLVDDRVVRTGALRGHEFVALPRAQAGTRPRIAVETVDLHGQTSPRTVVSPLLLDSLAPAIPAGLTATSHADRSATVTWPPAARAAAYDIEVDGRRIATTGAASATLPPSTGAAVRSVRVTAVDGAGRRSLGSAPLFVTTT